MSSKAVACLRYRRQQKKALLEEKKKIVHRSPQLHSLKWFSHSCYLHCAVMSDPIDGSSSQRQPRVDGSSPPKKLARSDTIDIRRDVVLPGLDLFKNRPSVMGIFDTDDQDQPGSPRTPRRPTTPGRPTTKEITGSASSTSGRPKKEEWEEIRTLMSQQAKMLDMFEKYIKADQMNKEKEKEKEKEREGQEGQADIRMEEQEENEEGWQPTEGSTRRVAAKLVARMNKVAAKTKQSMVKLAKTEMHVEKLVAVVDSLAEGKTPKGMKPFKLPFESEHFAKRTKVTKEFRISINPDDTWLIARQRLFFETSLWNAWIDREVEKERLEELKKATSYETFIEDIKLEMHSYSESIKGVQKEFGLPEKFQEEEGIP